MLYSKNGSIPKPQKDSTDGWIEVPDPPIAPEGKEVVWWYPPGWVVRDIKPTDEDDYVWKWSQHAEQWIKYERTKQVDAVLKLTDTPDVLTSSSVSTLTSEDVPALTSEQITPLR